MARIKTITPIPDSGLSESLATEIFDQISAFAGYGFNKSHAAAYAAISFRTAWLKRHHPEAFFAAAMNLDLGEVDEIAVFAADLKSRGLPLWQPSVNGSRAIFTPLKLRQPVGGYHFGIAYALSAIRGVGRDAADAIVAEREAHGTFRSIEDFLRRTEGRVNKTALQALAKAGAFDLFGASRAEAMGAVAGRAAASDTRQVSMFDLMDAAPQVATITLSRDEALDNEFDVLGHYMSEHPLEPLKATLFEDGLYFSDFVLNGSAGRLRKAAMAAVVCGIDIRRTRSGDVMAVLTLSDPEGTYEAVAFSEAWSKIRGAVKKKARLIVDVAVTDRGGERRLLVDDVRAIGMTPSRAAA